MCVVSFVPWRRQLHLLGFLLTVVALSLATISVCMCVCLSLETTSACVCLPLSLTGLLRVCIVCVSKQPSLSLSVSSRSRYYDLWIE